VHVALPAASWPTSRRGRLRRRASRCPRLCRPLLTRGNVSPHARPSNFVRTRRSPAWGRRATKGNNGELETKTTPSGTTQYLYNELGHLRSVSLPDGRVIEYKHDAMGRRIAKLVNGVTVAGWLYFDGLRPAAQVAADGSVTAVYVYSAGSNLPDYIVEPNGGRFRIVTDHLGSVRLVVNAATGAVVQRMGHDEFGRVLVDTNPGSQPFGFAGGLWDPDTGLVRFGARDYDPETGRWTAKDPIDFASRDTNLYAYVGNEPINRIDPTGLVELWPTSGPGGFLGPLTDMAGRPIGWRAPPTAAGAGAAASLGAAVVAGAAGYGIGSLIDYAFPWIGDYWADKFMGDPASQQSPFSAAPKAPGCPGKGEGYTPPKNWNERLVPNPNSGGRGPKGYPDDKGRVWIPTGPTGHGGPPRVSHKDLTVRRGSRALRCQRHPSRH